MLFKAILTRFAPVAVGICVCDIPPASIAGSNPNSDSEVMPPMPRKGSDESKEESEDGSKPPRYDCGGCESQSDCGMASSNEEREAEDDDADGEEADEPEGCIRTRILPS